jgi:hypothetical protein
MTIATSFGAGQRGLERFPPDVNRTAVGWVKRSATQHLTAGTKSLGRGPLKKRALTQPTWKAL